jgi:hypothetical protein
MIIEVKHVILNSSHKDYGRHFRISLRSDNDNAYFVIPHETMHLRTKLLHFLYCLQL